MHNTDSIEKLIMNTSAVVFIKYIVAIVLIMAIVCAPAYLAQQTEKDKTATTKIHVGCYLLGWTIIGWIWALFAAAKKSKI